MNLTEFTDPLIDTMDVDIDFWVLRGQIIWRNDSLQNQLQRINEEATSKKAILYLNSPGGIPDDVYRIGRAFQNTYEDFFIYVLEQAKSAATLLSISADELLMDNYSELGPLDIQIQKRDEIADRSSALDLMNALDYLDERSYDSYEDFIEKLNTKKKGNISLTTAMEYSSDVIPELYGRIYEKIEPMRLGKIQRSQNVALEYGKKLADVSENIDDQGIVDLVFGYPSHTFVIDRKEAKDLFHLVNKPSEFESINDIDGVKLKHISDFIKMFYVRLRKNVFEKFYPSDDNVGGDDHEETNTEGDAEDETEEIEEEAETPPNEEEEGEDVDPAEDEEEA